MGFKITRSADTIVEIPLACDEALVAANTPERVFEWASNHSIEGLVIPDDAVSVRIRPLTYAERCALQDSAPLVNLTGARLFSDYLESDSKIAFLTGLSDSDRRALNTCISQNRKIQLERARKMVVHVSHKMFDAPIGLDEFLSMIGRDADMVLFEITSHCDAMSSISEQQGKV